jgi:hypothetical protein
MRDKVTTNVYDFQTDTEKVFGEFHMWLNQSQTLSAAA